MTKVILQASISGDRDGEPWPPRGSVVDLPKDEAEHLIHAGLAVPSKGSTSIESTDSHIVAQPVLEAATIQTEPGKPVYRDLVAELKRRGLPTDGNTEVLAKRLADAPLAAPEEAPPAEDEAPAE